MSLPSSRFACACCVAGLGLGRARPWRATGQAQEIPSFARDVPAIRTGEPIFQFNGKDLTGFYTYLHEHKYDDPTKVFTVHDGMIHISGEEFGGLTTQRRVSRLSPGRRMEVGRADLRLAEAKARATRGSCSTASGPTARPAATGWSRRNARSSKGAAATSSWSAAREKPSLTCETRVGPDGQLYFEKGGKSVTRDSGRYNWWGRDPAWKDVLGFRGSRDVEKPAGEWNRMEVICDGDSITNIVNGYVVNIGTKSSLTKGKIIFQSEGAEIFFRKIEVRPLIKSPNG